VSSEHRLAPQGRPPGSGASGGHTRRSALGALSTLLLASLLSQGCSRETPSRGQTIPPGATVLALGDSLTFGTGAPPAAAFPARLAERSGWQVVNAGVPGDTAAQALARAPGLLAQHRPALVILSIGGNDLLRRGDEAALRDTVRRTVALAREAGAQVLLVAVPRPTLAARLTGSLDDHPLYAELARELAVPLHADGWSRVLAEARWRSDTIHANAAGYEVFADGLLVTLRAAGLLAGG
jgi:lysophospholipase L1-like esterase